MKQCTSMVTFGGDARLASAPVFGVLVLPACGGERDTELQASAKFTLPAHLPLPDLLSELAALAA